MKIEMYAPTSSFCAADQTEDMPEVVEYAQRCREYARRQIELAWPDADVEVLDEDNVMDAWCDDDHEIEDVQEFCNRLGDDFPGV